ncbi:DNA-directed RNA polymerase subunit D [Candidatus Woesearchaeota archaeon]|nr:DNA-directed RNA polymerase subunit D [Candidatus Woesearchaeota archaeon]
MIVTSLESDKKNGKISFVLEQSSPAFANMLRRSIINDIPTMAIEDVEFRKNTSVLYDEIVAHRLGLIPIKTDLKSYNLPANCACEGAGCAKCSLKLTLKAKGPGVVYASEIESQDPKVVPVHPKMPIVKLTKGQQIEIEATAILGTGSEHSKWSAGHCFFKCKPDIKIGKVDNADMVAKICPVNVFDVKSGKLVINKDNYFKCHLCGACTDVADIKLNESDSDFIFFVESWGQLKPSEMINCAVEYFQQKVEKLSESFK